MAKTRQNTSKNARFRRSPESESGARPGLLAGSTAPENPVDGGTGRAPEPEAPEAASTPNRESGANGPSTSAAIGRVLDTLAGRSGARDKAGRFTAGVIRTGERSEQYWQAMAGAKAEIVAGVRAQLAADSEDGAPVLLALIDGFAEASLLRRSTFLQLTRLGGPYTSKGKARALLNAWATFFDREMRAAEKLGLERRSRAPLSIREWLERTPREDEPDADAASPSTPDADADAEATNFERG